MQKQSVFLTGNDKMTVGVQCGTIRQIISGAACPSVYLAVSLQQATIHGCQRYLLHNELQVLVCVDD